MLTLDDIRTKKLYLFPRTPAESVYLQAVCFDAGVVWRDSKATFTCIDATIKGGLCISATDRDVLTQGITGELRANGRHVEMDEVRFPLPRRLFDEKSFIIAFAPQTREEAAYVQQQLFERGLVWPGAKNKKAMQSLNDCVKKGIYVEEGKIHLGTGKHFISKKKVLAYDCWRLSGCAPEDCKPQLTTDFIRNNDMIVTLVDCDQAVSSAIQKVLIECGALWKNSGAITSIACNQILCENKVLYAGFLASDYSNYLSFTAADFAPLIGAAAAPKALPAPSAVAALPSIVESFTAVATAAPVTQEDLAALHRRLDGIESTLAEIKSMIPPPISIKRRI